ncbi:MAG: hypothetical protein L0Y58_12640 [Verrucomicrobia subdivision 3 bacterium]|nr:hypothetical protein [Limisphaerales bacterium]
MERVVAPEILDQLPVAAPEAAKSRRDLVRLNALMGHARIIRHALARRPVHKLIDLGAGDGTMLLTVLRGTFRPASLKQVTLVDRQPSVRPETVRTLERLGVSVQVVANDVFDFLECAPMQQDLGLTANLLLHHFCDVDLKRLIAMAAAKCDFFVACEPRRAILPAIGAALAGAVGCNSVTRHDARVSVRAGFRGSELTALWPNASGWRVQERRSGLFSHLFVAERIV